MNDSVGSNPAPAEDEYAKRRREAKQRREESEEKADKVGSWFFSLVSGGIFGVAFGFAASECREKASEAPGSPYAAPYQPDLWCTVLTAENFHPEIAGIMVGLLVAGISYFAAYLYFHYLAP
ncbi:MULTISPECIES: hypothetical protein [unclassified Arthrobacter]|uniref:hypothetical protein n=1 Tax=unclassified Arthrobacter TaxID=235627 RepID=UPI001E44E356|nr:MULTISPECIES: hypothetical protein [unclassified Arthrobacter]MCC9145504.1 hypothetical protein [Arthrobacter sp. zg-Y919]MDK1276732.1 hypothetical protein [Arthrobacter sp. zg.Y919]WIB04324.1 hypothetical protein QNO10_06665 [Arthrobacter sp. zg-Y919]